MIGGQGQSSRMWWEGAMATTGKVRYPSPKGHPLYPQTLTLTPNSLTASSRKPSMPDSTLEEICPI